MLLPKALRSVSYARPQLTGGSRLREISTAARISPSTHSGSIRNCAEDGNLRKPRITGRLRVLTFPVNAAPQKAEEEEGGNISIRFFSSKASNFPQKGGVFTPLRYASRSTQKGSPAQVVSNENSSSSSHSIEKHVKTPTNTNTGNSANITAKSPHSSPYSLAKKGLNIEFKTVPFVKEDLQEMIKEVPEFKYYLVGNEDAQENVYSSVPLDQPIELEDEEEVLSVQKAILSKKKLKEEGISASSTPFFTPKAEESFTFSKLENGLKIASLDKKGLTSSLGLFVHCGSRFEDPSNFGVSHMLENMAFYSTAHLSWLRTVKTIETLGAQAACNIGREHIVYSAECLRQYVPILLPLLTGNVLFPRFLRWEMKENVHRLTDQREKLEKSPDAFITELLHVTAWHNNTLGHRLYALEKSLSYYNSDVLREFMLNHFSPDRMVFVGVNVEHEVLTKWLMRAFVDYNAIPSQPVTTEVPRYTGGDCRHPSDSPLAHLAIAFETPNGWNSDDLVPLTLLQSLMGGGGSFSTGGPGKGMHTRLFLNVLNRNEWVESCGAFNTQYTDSGLFGIYMTAHPSQGLAMAHVVTQELKNMQHFTSAELKRAKNALKSSIWMNLESRSILMEDVARQLLMTGQVIGGGDFCSAIDSVTEQDLRRIAAKLITGVPTVVAYGDVSTIPHYNDICSMLPKA